QVAPLPTARYLLAAAAAPCPPGQTGTCVYAVGGRGTTFNVQGEVESLNAVGDAWTTLPSLPTPRSHLAAATTQCPPGQGGMCVYAAGGSTSSGLLGTVEALDPPPAASAR
ncbi:kelch repeat-containing protein, partial [Streptomyces sp.]|uniref:kelch repeat-containing protein n=1 Tax=Streptomyces sp. TaxID=1931 RepID=UPI002F91F961